MKLNLCSQINTDNANMRRDDNFESQLDKETFVDKTLFIKTIIENDNFTLLTAPPKCGKTTIINMLKKFLEIEVKFDGCYLTYDFGDDVPVTDSYNYKMYNNHKLAINKHERLFKEHFGKTPVIHVDMRVRRDDAVVMDTLYDAVKLIKEAVHYSFMEHQYLVNSDRLASEHRRYVQTWCDEHSYKTMVDVPQSLLNLSRYLRAHFHDRRVFVLVDNYDFVIRHALDRVVDRAEVSKIVEYCVGVVRDVVRNNEANVRGALIAGVTTFPFINKSDLNDCSTYRFLGDHVHFNYFGLNENEIAKLFSNSHYKLDTIKFSNFYNGYQSLKGKKLYNLFSTLQFLKTGLYRSYFADSSFPKHLTKLITTPLVAEAVEGLVENKTMAMDCATNQTISEYLTSLQSAKDAFSSNELLSLLLQDLFDWGLLTFDLHQESFLNDVVVMRNFVSVKLPNAEIKEFLNEKLRQVQVL